MTPPAPLNPGAMPLSSMAALLRKVGSGTVTEAMLAADVKAGAPTNPDGTLNLVHYVAWLLRETADDE